MGVRVGLGIAAARSDDSVGAALRARRIICRDFLSLTAGDSAGDNIGVGLPSKVGPGVWPLGR